MILRRLDDQGVAIEELSVDLNEDLILGRGPLMKITDTRISRNHAKLTFDKEKKLLVFMNIGKKPCYVKQKQTEVEKEFSVIEKDESIELENGSVFGLLEDQYIYEINELLINDKSKEVSNKDAEKVDILNESDHDSKPSSSTNCEAPKCDNDLKENNNSTNTNAKNVKRPSCLYGKYGCTRKNPNHFVEEAHPGDEDYTEIAQSSDNENEDSNVDDSRPECEYGLDCYRKNPQHRKDYKHSSRPRQAKRKAKEKAAKNKKAKNEGDDDDYDSSFIDDDESDMEDITDDEESVDEWVPDDDDD